MKGHGRVKFGLLALLMAALASPVLAQTSHRSVLGDLAFACVEHAFQDSRIVRINGSGLTALVEPVLIERLVAAGKKLAINTVGDSTRPESGVELAYRVESARTELTRKGKKDLNRTVFLDMTFQLIDLSGESVIDAGVCSDSSTDVILRSQANTLSHKDFPEVNPEISSNNLFSRWIQPVVLVAATAVGTYLLFNLRSRRADGG